MGTGVDSPAGETAGAWSEPVTSTQRRVQEWVELYLYSPVCHLDMDRDNISQLHRLHRTILDVWSTYDRQLAITVTVCLRSGSVNNG